MSEAGDYTPATHWGGHDFDKARKDYDKHVGRSYADAKAAGRDPKGMVPESISTNSTAPLLICCDITGSMGDWPATIFSKLPYLEHEGKEYLGEEVEIAFGAVGDATCDDYPLQIQPFAKGVDWKKNLEALVIEGNGGGQCCETYEIAGLYYARNVSMPKAIKPILIMIGDEAPYDSVNPDDAKEVAKVSLEKRITTKEIFAELKAKYSFYLILKPYGNYGGTNTIDPITKSIREKWLKLVDADHIADLPDPNRVVDVIFGILAKETGRVDYFREEIEDRQKPDQVKTAYKALRTIHAISDKDPKEALPPGASVLFDKDDDGETKPLL